jgi:hypothetical protein
MMPASRHWGYGDRGRHGCCLCPLDLVEMVVDSAQVDR